MPTMSLFSQFKAKNEEGRNKAINYLLMHNICDPDDIDGRIEFLFIAGQDAGSRKSLKESLKAEMKKKNNLNKTWLIIRALKLCSIESRDYEALKDMQYYNMSDVNRAIIRQMIFDPMVDDEKKIAFMENFIARQHFYSLEMLANHINLAKDTWQDYINDRNEDQRVPFPDAAELVLDACYKICLDIRFIRLDWDDDYPKKFVHALEYRFIESGAQDENTEDFEKAFKKQIDFIDGLDYDSLKSLESTLKSGNLFSNPDLLEFYRDHVAARIYEKIFKGEVKFRSGFDFRDDRDRIVDALRDELVYKERFPHDNKYSIGQYLEKQDLKSLNLLQKEIKKRINRLEYAKRVIEENEPPLSPPLEPRRAPSPTEHLSSLDPEGVKEQINQLKKLNALVQSKIDTSPKPDRSLLFSRGNKLIRKILKLDPPHRRRDSKNTSRDGKQPRGDGKQPRGEGKRGSKNTRR